MGSVGDLRPSL